MTGARRVQRAVEGGTILRPPFAMESFDDLEGDRRLAVR